MIAKTRRPATHEDMFVGAIVYKGNGKTAWRVTAHGQYGYSVVKASTTADAKGNAALSLGTFTVED